MRARSTAASRLGNPEAVLTRGDVAELGYERRAVDAIFRAASWITSHGVSPAPVVAIACGPQPETRLPKPSRSEAGRQHEHRA